MTQTLKQMSEAAKIHIKKNRNMVRFCDGKKESLLLHRFPYFVKCIIQFVTLMLVSAAIVVACEATLNKRISTQKYVRKTPSELKLQTK